MCTDGSRHAVWAATAMVLAVAALLAACGGTARNVVVHGPATPATPVSRAMPATSPTHELGPAADTPGTAVVIQTTDIVLTPAAHLDFAASGFTAGEALTIRIAGVTGATEMSLPQAQADASGDLPPISLVMTPALAPGRHYVEVIGQSSRRLGSADFQIQRMPPTVQLDPYTGKPGAAIGVSGSGFIVGEAVAVYLGTMAGNPVAVLTADQGGHVLGQLTVPTRPAGQYTLYLVGRMSDSPATVGFSVQAIDPWIVLQNYAPSVGSAVTASGSDFASNERVLVYLNTVSGTPKAIIQTDTRGTFSNVQVFVVPANLAEHETVIFVGEHSHAQTTTAFDILPSQGASSTPSPTAQP